MLEISIIEISVTDVGFALMLKAPDRKKIVPIFIGPLETYSISTAIGNQKTNRPLTHDLMKNALLHTNAFISKVVLDHFQNGTFFAKLYINVSSDKKNTPQKVIEIDARPSDAIAMAIRFQSPIYITEEIYDETSLDLELVRKRIQDISKEEHDSLIDSLSELIGVDSKGASGVDESRKEQELKEDMNLETIDQNLETIDQNLETIDQKLETIDQKLETIDQSLEGDLSSSPALDKAKNQEKKDKDEDEEEQGTKLIQNILDELIQPSDSDKRKTKVYYNEESESGV